MTDLERKKQKLLRTQEKLVDDVTHEYFKSFVYDDLGRLMKKVEETKEGEHAEHSDTTHSDEQKRARHELQKRVMHELNEMSPLKKSQLSKQLDREDLSRLQMRTRVLQSEIRRADPKIWRAKPKIRRAESKIRRADKGYQLAELVKSQEEQSKSIKGLRTKFDTSELLRIRSTLKELVGERDEPLFDASKMRNRSEELLKRVDKEEPSNGKEALKILGLMKKLITSDTPGDVANQFCENARSYNGIPVGKVIQELEEGVYDWFHEVSTIKDLARIHREQIDDCDKSEESLEKQQLELAYLHVRQENLEEKYEGGGLEGLYRCLDGIKEHLEEALNEKYGEGFADYLNPLDFTKKVQEEIERQKFRSRISRGGSTDNIRKLTPVYDVSTDVQTKKRSSSFS